MSNKPQYRLLEFGLSKKPWYRILIVNFYTELENYINFESTFVGVQKRIKINKKKFHNKSLDSELGTHNLSFGFLFFYLESAFKTKKKENPFLFLTTFLSFLEGKDYYSLDLGQDYSYARDRILRDMTKISPF
ncbi:hypothetical protein ACJX0J_004483 [Zea mays]